MADVSRNSLRSFFALLRSKKTCSDFFVIGLVPDNEDFGLIISVAE